MAEIENTQISNKSYLTTTSYRTSMSLIKNLQQITMAVYMVTDCVEDGEPLRNETRSAILLAMKSISRVMGNVQTSTIEFRSAHANLVLVREHLSVLEVMGYVSDMNAAILNAEIDKTIARLDTSILDMNTPHESLVPMRSDMNFGIDLGQLFYKNPENKGDSAEIDNTNTENNNEFPQKTLGKIEKEMGRLKRKSLILKLFREIPSQDGDKVLTSSELVDKYTRFGGEGQISEKTIQRELVELVGDGTLEKIGTKRWVKYRLIRNN